MTRPSDFASVVRDARVLLLDADRAASREVARVLRSTVREVVIVPSVDDVDASSKWNLIVVSYNGLDREEVGRLFSTASELADGKVLVCSDNGVRDDLADLFGEYGLTNLLAKNPTLDGAELLVTIQKILLNDIFGLTKYFPWGTAQQHITLRGSADRESAMEQVHALGAELGVRSRLLESFATVSDELITNALFNAPIDDSGNRPFAHLSRTENISLDSDKPVSVDLCTDGQRLGIAVSDSYGSLTLERITSYMAKCFRKGADQVDTKHGGAGLGLYQTFESLSQFTLNIAPHRKTEVIGVLDVRGRYKDFALRAKSFNIFIEAT